MCCKRFTRVSGGAGTGCYRYLPPTFQIFRTWPRLCIRMKSNGRCASCLGFRDETRPELIVQTIDGGGGGTKRRRSFHVAASSRSHYAGLCSCHALTALVAQHLRRLSWVGACAQMWLSSEAKVPRWTTRASPAAPGVAFRASPNSFTVSHSS